MLDFEKRRCDVCGRPVEIKKGMANPLLRLYVAISTIDGPDDTNKYERKVNEEETCETCRDGAVEAAQTWLAVRREMRKEYGTPSGE